MANTEFETQVLSALGGINTRLDGIDGRLDGMDTKIDRLSTDLADFREHMEWSINSLGKLSNQAFAHINEIRAEVVSPWKINNSK